MVKNGQKYFRLLSSLCLERAYVIIMLRQIPAKLLDKKEFREFQVNTGVPLQDSRGGAGKGHGYCDGVPVEQRREND